MQEKNRQKKRVNGIRERQSVVNRLIFSASCGFGGLAVNEFLMMYLQSRRILFRGTDASPAVSCLVSWGTE